MVWARRAVAWRKAAWTCVAPAAVLAVTAVGLPACKGHASGGSAAPGPAADASALPVVEEPREAIDAGVGVTTVKIAALESPTPIQNAPEWPAKDPTKASEERAGVVRLGYLRKGQVVDAKPSIVKKANCPEGWYELVGGGWICGKSVTRDLSAKELADAPHAPFMDKPLPYDYGLNLTNGAPAYRRYPTRVERKQYEANLVIGKTPPNPRAEAASAPAEDGSGTPWYLRDHPSGARPQVSLDELHDSEGPVKERMVRGFYVSLDVPLHKFSGKFWRTTRGLWIPADFLLVHKASTEFEGVHLGEMTGLAAYATSPGESPEAGAPASSPAPSASALPVAVVAAPSGSAPALPPQAASAAVDPGSAGSGSSGSADEPDEPDAVKPESPAAAAGAGVTMPKQLPVAWALALHTRQYHFKADGKPKRGPHVPRFTAVGLTGNKKVADDRKYYETTDGFYLRDVDITLTRPGPPPKDLASGEKWIDVNITTETLVAYEGDKPVFATLISSGKHDDKDPTKDHRTKTGSFRIREKHIAATMDADTSTDGPYSIQDVPWIEYFEGSYALHGAFWHSSFGKEHSHGCVNLMPKDAQTLFAWTGPKLPPGWHGVHATDANPGTRVLVHE